MGAWDYSRRTNPGASTTMSSLSRTRAAACASVCCSTHCSSEVRACLRLYSTLLKALLNAMLTLLTLLLCSLYLLYSRRAVPVRACAARPLPRLTRHRAAWRLAVRVARVAPSLLGLYPAPLPLCSRPRAPKPAPPIPTHPTHPCPDQVRVGSPTTVDSACLPGVRGGIHLMAHPHGAAHDNYPHATRAGHRPAALGVLAGLRSARRRRRRSPRRGRV